MGRVVKVPPIEEVPEIIRGKSFAIVQAAYLGNEHDGAELMRPLVELGPELNTFAMSPRAPSATSRWIPTRRCPTRARRG